MAKLALHDASLASLVATLITTSIHHIFRLGPELLLPSLVGVLLPIALFIVYRRTGKPLLLWIYATYAALVVLWFGFLDGFLDHVAKSAGWENTTFLPGGEAEVVATAMTLWSQEASTAFYEGTGVLSAALALLTLITTGFFVVRELSAEDAGAIVRGSDGPNHNARDMEVD